MLDTPTLIVVDSNKIAAGFLRNFTKFFGREWTSRNVGRIQQDSCNYNDKPFCIAMVQSLMSRKYPEGLYSHFGLVVYDEVQIFGSRYHKALGMFKARVLVGMTATNKKGRFGTLVSDYLGTPAVVSRQEVLKPKAFIVRNRLDTLYNVYSDGTLINSLASDKRRNKLVANIIFEHGYKRNRVCLVLSDRVAQLQAIQHILLSMGVEPDRVGLHVAEYDAQTFTVSYSYGKTQQRLDLAVTNAEANRIAMLLDSGDYKDIADILPFALEKNLRQGMPVSFSVVRNTVKASQEALDTIANFCNIILATYKIFAKGVDYPRIDMGVEATPYGNITQPLGRTLRSADGFYKPQPEWYAIHDRFVMPPRKSFSSDWDKQIKIAQAMNHFFDKKASAREKSLLNAKATITYISGSTYRSTDNA
jgi:superfamily II DNA or RNA helicase